MNSKQYRLSCRHMVRLPITDTTPVEAYCRFDGWQRITVEFDTEWHVFCLDCNYGRWCGQRQREAERRRDAHAEKGFHRTFALVDIVTRDGRGILKEKKKKSALRLLPSL